MSGTSLDGLDIALVDIEEYGNSQRPTFNFQLLAAETVPYPDEWVRRLSSLEQASAYEYALADVELGHYMGRCVKSFISKYSAYVELIASHGHTIFHQPHLCLTTQIGCGDAIAAETGLPVAFNFRRLDVALGGQGAPLVPIGDRLLFGQYDACLNLGGIANISYEFGSERIAYDICPCNMALNHLARLHGMPYDRDGLLARGGEVDEALLHRMNSLEYYRLPAPKSLGKEWFVEQFLPLLSPGALRTTTEHIAQQIALSLGSARTLLVTGGGARNLFLVERLQALAPQCRLVVPDKQTIDYKEAIVFALLGYLRINGMANTLGSVTGAGHDSVGGDLAGLAFAR